MIHEDPAVFCSRSSLPIPARLAGLFTAPLLGVYRLGPLYHLSATVILLGERWDLLGGIISVGMRTPVNCVRVRRIVLVLLLLP